VGIRSKKENRIVAAIRNDDFARFRIPTDPHRDVESRTRTLKGPQRSHVSVRHSGKNHNGRRHKFAARGTERFDSAGMAETSAHESELRVTVKSKGLAGLCLAPA